MSSTRQLARFQGPGGIRCSPFAAPSGSVTVNVGPSDASVEVINPATGEVTTHPVEPGKDTQVPIPNVPGGTILILRAGKGLNSRNVVIEVIAPGS